MNAEEIARLILLFAEALPALVKLADQVRGTLSETDQASVDASLAALRANALTHIAQAETDLDAAAQQ